MAGSGPTGGLPIKAGTEDTTITSSDLLDPKDGKFKRQAARFKIFQYPESNSPETYPMGLPSEDVQEITIGCRVGDKIVTDIVWTVHVANKKANTFTLAEERQASEGVFEGICGYHPPNLPPLRNWTGDPKVDKIAVLNDPERVKVLTIDAGPRTISGTNAPAVAFDKATPASYGDAHGNVIPLDNYPKSFPEDFFCNPAQPGQPGLDCPSGPIDTLGELQTDDHGRLLVLGGYGRACGWNPQSAPPLPHLPNGDPLPFRADVNNDQWFDDASDGSVSAVIRFDDGSVQPVQAGAWVVTTDPSYAPQILNVVSLFDDIYDSWIRKLNLIPKLYRGTDALICKDGIEGLPETWFTQFNRSYKPDFDSELNPIFQSVALQKWMINLNQTPGIQAHDLIGKITTETNPDATSIQHLAFIRLPGTGTQTWNPFNPQMPAALGDANQSFLTVTPTQYFLLYQWANKPENPSTFALPPLGPGEQLDKAVLVSCLGGDLALAST